MKEFKGTKGPWKVWMGTYIENDAGSGVCEVFGDLTSLSEDEANAKLIAAAPDLLELLIWLVDIEGPQPGNSEWASHVNAAIAKALGESK